MERSNSPDGIVETKRKWQFSKIWHGVWESRVGPMAKLVYAAIDWHGKEAFPSQHRLAKMTGLSVDSVQRAIRELKRAGFLTVIRRQRKSSLYVLNPEGRSKNSHSGQ